MLDKKQWGTLPNSEALLRVINYSIFGIVVHFRTSNNLQDSIYRNNNMNNKHYVYFDFESFILLESQCHLSLSKCTIQLERMHLSIILLIGRVLALSWGGNKKFCRPNFRMTLFKEKFSFKRQKFLMTFF